MGKAYMLGGVTKGPVLAAFQLLKDAGFEGVELISPNQLDPSEVLAARDKTGLVIHGVSGGRHWRAAPLRPRPEGRRAGAGRDPPGVPGLQGLRRHHRAASSRRWSTRRSPTATPTRDRRRTSASSSPTPSRPGSRSPSRRSGTSSSSAPSSSPATSTSSRAPGSAPISTSATSSSSATPRSGSASWASGSSRSTSRNMPSRSGSTTSSARGRSTGPPCARRSIDVGYDGWITAEVGYGDLAAMKDVVRRMNQLLQLG